MLQTKKTSSKTLRLRLLERVLFAMARITLAVKRPFVVGITGSVGKTSAKDAIIHVLETKYAVRGPYANYNNEIGLPLTIIGARTAGTSCAGWLVIGFGWLKSFAKPYPEILVLEYGIDHPGDMDTLISLVSPHVAVHTHVSDAHIAHFENIAHIAREKAKLIAATAPSERDSEIGGVILNGDVKRVLATAHQTTLPVYTIGDQDIKELGADINATGVHMNITEDGCNGLSFKANMSGKSVPIRLEKIIARHHVYAALAAIGVGTIFKMNLVEIAEGLASFEAPPGRMRLLSGKHGSHIIDDTYNASPDAVLAALTTLAEFPGKDKIAILGDMLELGDDEMKLHEKIIKRAIKEKTTRIALVGRRMCSTRELLEDAGYVYGDTVVCADGPEEIVDWVFEHITAGDTVLIKGSQAMRLEKVTQHLVGDTVDRAASLPRQSKDWKEKPYIQP